VRRARWAIIGKNAILTQLAADFSTGMAKWIRRHELKTEHQVRRSQAARATARPRSRELLHPPAHISASSRAWLTATGGMRVFAERLANRRRGRCSAAGSSAPRPASRRRG
jgi:hypothetical protein